MSHLRWWPHHPQSSSTSTTGTTNCTSSPSTLMSTGGALCRRGPGTGWKMLARSRLVGLGIGGSMVRMKSNMPQIRGCGESGTMSWLQQILSAFCNCPCPATRGVLCLFAHSQLVVFVALDVSFCLCIQRVFVCFPSSYQVRTPSILIRRDMRQIPMAATLTAIAATNKRRKTRD